MEFYYIKESYIEFLREFDTRVLCNKNESRPYIGIVLHINDIDYFAPFSSPKDKHLKMSNTIDFRKIDNGRLGAINLNNMIPVTFSALIPIKIKKIKNVKYRRLLQKQYISITNDCLNIEKAAFKLYNVLIAEDDLLFNYYKRLKTRCCNIKLLEKVYKSYDDINK